MFREALFAFASGLRKDELLVSSCNPTPKVHNVHTTLTKEHKIKEHVSPYALSKY
jgi:hypothetical protein